MSVSTTLNKQIFPGNAATTVFSFSFAFPFGTPAQEAANFQVYYTDPFGNITLLVQGVGPTNYQITFNAPVSPNPTPVGGAVTYNPLGTPIPVGSFLTVIRVMPVTQPSAFANQGTFYPTAAELTFDYQAMLSQQVLEVQGRSLVVPIGDPTPNSLPSAVARAGLFLAFDSNGNPIAQAAGGGGSGVISFNGRTGTVLPAGGDYSFAQLTGNIAVGQMNSGTGAAANTYWNGSGTWAQVNFNQLAGNISTSQMNSGTNASNLSYWRGDGAWVNFTGTALTWTATQNFATLTASSVSTPSLQTTGAFITPIPSVQVGSTYTASVATPSVIFNTTATCTVTLPSAASNPGAWFFFKNIAAFAINSATANVVPQIGGAAGTAILAATAGKWCNLQSDSTNWQIMESN